MARRNQFVCNAESVQGNAGAEVTFSRITVGQRDHYLSDPTYNDSDMVREHILDWHGIEDDEGNEIPSPKDEPGVVAVLYVEEVTALVRLLFAGPDGDQVKN